MPKLVWTLSGDEIPLIPCNNELYEYFVSQLNTFNINNYSAMSIDHSELFAQFDEAVSVLNKVLKDKFKCLIFDLKDPNWHDQTLLNQLHRDWVKLHQAYPTITTLLETIEPGSSIYMYRLNKLIHNMEQQFDRFDLVNDVVSFENIFDYDLTTCGLDGLMINYNNLGRSSLNKWLNFDIVDDDSDTNNFKEIYTELTLSLSRPRSYTLPAEYKKNSLLGDNIGLANFDKLEENLLNYRQLVYKNFRLPSNLIELH